MSLADLLTDGLFLDGDWVESKDQDPKGDVRLIQLADIGDGGFRNRSHRFLTSKRAHELGCTFLEMGDILVARMPEPLGRACLFPGVGQPAVTAVDICIVRPNPTRVLPTWLVRAINSPQFREAMQSHIRGTTRQRISRRNLGTLTLPVLSVNEQRALVQRLDELDGPRTSGQEHLGVAGQALERFRQSVLAAACSGELTAQWRLSRRRSLAPDLNRKLNNLDDLDVPTEWQTSHMDELCTKITSGSRDWTPYYGRGAGTFVMAQNVRRGSIDWSYRQAVDPPLTDSARDRSQIRMGDLLVTIVGANTGDVGPVNEDRPQHYVCQSVALMRPRNITVTPFLNLWFSSLRHGRKYLMECAYGAGRPHLSFVHLRNAPVALPSQEEQDQIIRRVAELDVLADDVEARIDKANRSLSDCASATIEIAFSGRATELLPVAASEGD